MTIKKITLWRREVDSRPGALADVLEPFASTGTDLQVVMRYRHPQEDNKAIIEVCPPCSPLTTLAISAVTQERYPAPAVAAAARPVHHQ